MTKAVDSLIQYEEKILEIPIKKILPNPFNPRKRFVESEEDELIESIISKGIIKPVVVFKDKKSNNYILLDGERRYKVCEKLNFKSIPAFVLIQKPNTLQNLSLMFHIHNVREEWTEFAVALTIKRIIDELGKEVEKLSSQDIAELSKLTSLSRYKVNKYLTFLDYPKEVTDLFLESEKLEKPIDGMDPDILLEMHKPIEEIKNQMPEILNKYSIQKIINACVRKKAMGVITTNKDFRFLKDTLIASGKGEIRKEIVKEKILEFVDNEEFSPKDIFEQTAAESTYKVKSIIKKSEKLFEEINNLDINKITIDEKNSLSEILKELMLAVQQKFKIK